MCEGSAFLLTVQTVCVVLLLWQPMLPARGVESLDFGTWNICSEMRKHHEGDGQTIPALETVYSLDQVYCVIEAYLS